MQRKTWRITIIDDYAHHPTEIAATLTAARNYPHTVSSAYSSLTHTPGQKPSGMSSQKHFLWPI
ncbi:MAG: cyanophycin synthetase [Eubacterium ramulus]